MIIKEAYERGCSAALEKLGYAIAPAGQTAGSSIGNGFKVKMTKSVSNPKNLSTKSTNHKLGPTNRAGPTSSSTSLI